MFAPGARRDAQGRLAPLDAVIQRVGRDHQMIIREVKVTVRRFPKCR